mmetsp:Transcript_3221/g.11223  ORF Transcript_3221/g.11223 Transcript_3221/m.11223 type:complete len:274 (+) Transcript_3221:2160-2981(+)
MKKILQRIIALALFYDGLPRPGGLQVRQNGEGAASRNTAHVFADGSHPEVAVHPPLLSPRVLDDPVVVLRIISNGQHRVVEGVRALPALVRGERPVFIESEGRDDLEGDGDGARVPNRLHHRGFVTLGDVHDLFHEDGGRLWLVLAGGAIVAQVRVRDLQINSSVELDICHGVLRPASAASPVVERDGAVQYLLLGQRQDASKLQRVGGLQRSCGTESPAAPAPALVLDGGHDAQVPPVAALRVAAAVVVVVGERGRRGATLPPETPRRRLDR